MEIKEPLKTDKMENVGDNTKVEDSENSKEELKDISNTDKETKQTNILQNKKQTHQVRGYQRWVSQQHGKL